MRADVVVVGAGPAGLGLAAALVERGVDVKVVTAAPDAPWVNCYAGWAHELPESWPSWAEASWVAPEVRIDDARRHVLRRTYVRIDRMKLRAALLHRLGDRLLRGSVSQLDLLNLEDGQPLEAKLVVDATGAPSALTPRVMPDDPGFQVAYGELVELGDSLPMLLMDYSGPQPEGPPSFLYAMPLPDGRYFVEETVLVGRPAPDLAMLRTRLHARLDRLGLRRGPAQEVERCVIPMGLSRPGFGGPLAWGAAAGLIHPATGYSVARSLKEAPKVAEAIATGLSDGVDEARRRAWDVIWPEERQRAWAYYRFGMEALLRMDLAQTRDFFDGFFAHDDDTWAGWLAGDLSSAAIPMAMTRHFGRVPWRVRGTLVGTTMGEHGLRLVRQLFGRAG